MDSIVGLAALIVLSVPIALVAAFAVARGPDVMGQAFAPQRPAPWPRGVQEEDPSFDVTWRLSSAVRSTSARDADELDAPPAIVAVTGSVRRRRQPSVVSRSDARR